MSRVSAREVVAEIRGAQDVDLPHVLGLVPNAHQMRAVFRELTVEEQRRVLRHCNPLHLVTLLHSREIKALIATDPPFLGPLEALNDFWRVHWWTQHDAMQSKECHGPIREKYNDRARQWFTWITAVRSQTQTRELLKQIAAPLYRTAFDKVALSDEQRGQLIQGKLGVDVSITFPDDPLLRSVLAILMVEPQEWQRVVYVLSGTDRIAPIPRWINRPSPKGLGKRGSSLVKYEPPPKNFGL